MTKAGLHSRKSLPSPQELFVPSNAGNAPNVQDRPSPTDDGTKRTSSTREHQKAVARKAFRKEPMGRDECISFRSSSPLVQGHLRVSIVCVTCDKGSSNSDKDNEMAEVWENPTPASWLSWLGSGSYHKGLQRGEGTYRRSNDVASFD